MGRAGLHRIEGVAENAFSKIFISKYIIQIPVNMLDIFQPVYGRLLTGENDSCKQRIIPLLHDGEGSLVVVFWEPFTNSVATLTGELVCEMKRRCFGFYCSPDRYEMTTIIHEPSRRRIAARGPGIWWYSSVFAIAEDNADIMQCVFDPTER